MFEATGARMKATGGPFESGDGPVRAARNVTPPERFATHMTERSSASGRRGYARLRAKPAICTSS